MSLSQALNQFAQNLGRYRMWTIAVKIALSESECFHIGGDKVNGCDFVNCGRSRKKGKA